MKKILGYIFFVLGILFAFVLALYFVNRLPSILGASGEDGPDYWGFMLGTLFFFSMMIGIVVLLIWLGWKWIKTKRPIDTFHETP
jgi:hypothetical protein